MRKNSTVHCALWRFCVPLLLLASFSYAPSVLATAEISVYKSIPKPLPIAKTIPKLIPIVKPISNEEEKFKSLFPKSIPIVKPIPKLILILLSQYQSQFLLLNLFIFQYTTSTKPIPVVKSIPILKAILNSIFIVKSLSKPFIVKKSNSPI
ncbi:hypothetical protein GmHk_15G044941 [Glycine max]|nr:hypothetical protein GmHk_15G044941 [Glycine max]